MIRTHSLPPQLRIDITETYNGTVIVASDPSSGSQCLMTESGATVLADLSAYLWNRLRDIVRNNKLDPGIGEDARRTLLHTLYRVGHVGLLRLLGPQRSRLDEIREFFRARVSVRVPADELPCIIDIVGPTPDLLPLEVLPLLSSASVTDPENTPLDQLVDSFLGFHAIVRRVATSVASSGNPTGTRYDGRLSVRVFKHEELPGVHRELRGLADRKKAKKLGTTLLFPPHRHRPGGQWPERELAVLVRNMSDPQLTGGQGPAAHVCHFACHLKDDGYGSYLEMLGSGRSRPARYVLDEIEAAYGNIPTDGPRAKVLFLSVCRSAVRDQRLLTSVVAVLRYFEPQSIVGTMAEVPDLASAELALLFYDSFSEGSSVGASLRAARWSLLEDYGNPFGLLFLSYSGEDTFIAVTSDRLRRYVPNENDIFRALA